MKTKVVTARINENMNYEIEFLKSSLGLANTTSVLTHAIHILYVTTKERQSRKSSLEQFEEKGLMGCLEAAPELSTSYKDIISDSIAQKHSQPPTASSKKARKRNLKQKKI